MVLDWPAAQLFEAAECLTSNQWRYGLECFPRFRPCGGAVGAASTKDNQDSRFFFGPECFFNIYPRTDHDIRPYMSGITDARAMPAAGISSV